MKQQSNFRALLDEAIKDAQYEILTKVESELTERAIMLSNVLTNEVGLQIWLTAKHEVFWRMANKREEVITKSNTYSETAYIIFRMKSKLFK